VFDLHKIFTPAAEREACATGCPHGGIGCLDCKDVLLRHLVPRLDGIASAAAEDSPSGRT